MPECVLINDKSPLFMGIFTIFALIADGAFE